jgi:hypothetical protein
MKRKLNYQADASSDIQYITDKNRRGLFQYSVEIRASRRITWASVFIMKASLDFVDIELIKLVVSYDTIWKHKFNFDRTALSFLPRVAYLHLRYMPFIKEEALGKKKVRCELMTWNTLDRATLVCARRLEPGAGCVELSGSSPNSHPYHHIIIVVSLVMLTGIEETAVAFDAN